MAWGKGRPPGDKKIAFGYRVNPRYWIVLRGRAVLAESTASAELERAILSLKLSEIHKEGGLRRITVSLRPDTVARIKDMAESMAADGTMGRNWIGHVANSATRVAAGIAFEEAPKKKKIGRPRGRRRKA